MSSDKEILSLLLPENLLDYFEYKGHEKYTNHLRIILEEKNTLPPLPKEHKSKHIQSKGFKDIEIEDFPIRGRKVRLLLRRRVWKIKGVKQLHKRDIALTCPGTRLEKEFADFLKE